MSVPASLARVGILGVSDNLQPDQEIGGFVKDFVRIFRPELEAKYGGARRVPLLDVPVERAAGE